MRLLQPSVQPKRQSGFTLVELVSVLIIAGILAAVAVSRFYGSHGFEERGFYDETLAVLRYAQKSAIAQRRHVCANFTDKTVTLKIAASFATSPPGCGNDLLGPDGNPFVIDTGASGAKYGNASVQFSAYPVSVVFTPSGSVVAGATITVSGFTPSIAVEAETGYVH